MTVDGLACTETRLLHGGETVQVWRDVVAAQRLRETRRAPVASLPAAVESPTDNTRGTIDAPQFADSCFVFLVNVGLNVGLETRLSSGVHNAKTRSWRLIESTTDKQTTASSTPMNVFWRCDPPSQPCFSRRDQRPPLLRFRDSADW